MNMTETLQKLTGKSLADCTNQEIYLALLDVVRENSKKKSTPVTGRKLYYISAEFLIGKLLSNNLINLGLYDEVRTALADAGKSLSEIEEVEPEPSLGNGGLGRLAACFLDSLATLNLPGDGIGLRYHFGLFHQQFKDNLQNELPDPWLTEHSWAEKTDITYPVKLAGKSYTARLYKLAVTGYEGRTNTLNLFDLDTIDESIVEEGISFDKTAIAKNLTLFLYPDDSDEAGRLLRVYQQYMMVSAGAQLVLAECVARGCNYHDLADYAAIQINDTHPSMVIPELIRLLEEKGIAFVPLSITFDNDTYKDGIEISRSEFYKRMREEDTFPKTAQPSPQAFLDVFEEAKANGDQMIGVMLSGGISGTYQSANIAKDMAEYDGIHLIDSKTAVYAIKIMVDYGMQLRDEGKTVDEIVEALEELKSRISINLAIDNLENLYKGGRLTKMQAGFGNFAKLKPVISIPEGTLIVKGKFIGRKKAIAGLVSYIEGMDLDERFPIYGIYSDGTENLDNFVKKVEEKGIKFKECYQIGPTIGTHVGPETFGFIAVEKAKN